MNTHLDPRRKKSLERIVLEFGNLMVRALEPSLYEATNFIEREKLLIQVDTHLYAAEGCVNAMRRIWPHGDGIFDRLLLGISEFRKQRLLVEEFFDVISRDVPLDELRVKHREIMSKNREILMIASTYLAEAADLLYEQTGIEMKLE